MTISDQSKIRELSTPVSQSGTLTEPSLSFKNIKQSGFQSMLIKTIEHSQSSIAQQSRARNSEARYSTGAQPKLNAHEAEAARASAAKVSVPRTFQHTNRAEVVAQQHAVSKEGEVQSVHALNGQYITERLEMQNRIVNADVNIDAIQSSLGASALNFSEALDDQKNKSSYSSDPANSADSQLQEDRWIKETTIHTKMQYSESTHVKDDLSASEGGVEIAAEQTTSKLISLPSEHPRDAPKSAVNVAIQSYVGTEQWGREVRQKIVWMFGIGQQAATLTLNPPNLGPLHISVKMQNNVAHTTFRSNDPGVRQALAEGMVLLNDMMSQRGLILGQMTMTEIDQEVLRDGV